MSNSNDEITLNEILGGEYEDFIVDLIEGGNISEISISDDEPEIEVEGGADEDNDNEEETDNSPYIQIDEDAVDEENVDGGSEDDGANSPYIQATYEENVNDDSGNSSYIEIENNSSDKNATDDAEGGNRGSKTDMARINNLKDSKSKIIEQTPTKKEDPPVVIESEENISTDEETETESPYFQIDEDEDKDIETKGGKNTEELLEDIRDMISNIIIE
jgi:hypothetical protein